MKFLRSLLLLPLCTPWIGVAMAGGPVSKPAATSYLITNDDLPGKTPTSGTFFTIASDGTPQNPARVNLGGGGAAGGFFAANRVSILQKGTDACAFLSLGAGGEIAAVDIPTQQDIGDFAGSPTDTGVDNGVGLINNGTYLYASFSTSASIGTFAILPGCALQFLSDISPLGKHSGNVKGMALHGNMMVVTYGDGSIESFNIAAGTPVSNGDLQDATGKLTDRYPSGVDITPDGHFAIFGDVSTTTTVEVSDISSGKLTKTALYNVGGSANSSTVYLSPDASLVYITDTGSGRVTAAFFDKTTGKVTHGCTSATLNGYNDAWNFMGEAVTGQTTGTGSVLYVAEFGGGSGIAMINVTSRGGKCSLIEASGSPAVDPNSTNLLSIGVYPPRSF